MALAVSRIRRLLSLFAFTRSRSARRAASALGGTGLGGAGGVLASMVRCGEADGAIALVFAADGSAIGQWQRLAAGDSDLSSTREVARVTATEPLGNS